MKPNIEPHTRRKDVGALSGANVAERLTARMETAAVDLLERVLRRRRWSAVDKDAITSFLERLVLREIHAARPPAKEKETP